MLALVVTIVILIILAAVTITMIIGDNGIITQATDSKDKQQIAQEKDKIEQALLGGELEDLSKNEEANNADKIVERLENGKEQVDLTTINKIDDNTIEVITDKEDVFEIVIKDDQTTEVIYVGVASNLGPKIRSLKVTNSKTSIKVEVDVLRANNAKYRYYIKTENGTYNLMAENTSREYTYENLTENTIYYIKVEVENEKGKSEKERAVLTGEINITFEVKTWANKKANVQIDTNQIENNLQYKINEATTWKKIESGSIISDLSLGDTIYARIYDGTNVEKEANYVVTESGSPTVQLNVISTNTNSVTVRANAQDSQSGMPSSPTYTFYVNGTQKQSSTNNQFVATNLSQNTDYTIKVETRDNAGNLGSASKTAHTTTIPSGVTTGNITWGKVLWNNGTASVTISSNKSSQFSIQYQIGSTTGKWITGTTASGIANNATVYARLWDGVNGGEYASLKVMDNDAPTLKIEKKSVASNKIVIQATATDTNSGMPSSPQYNYYIKKTSQTDYPATPTHTGNDTTYTFTNLEEVTQYDIKVTVNDNANNTATATLAKVTTLSTTPTIEVVKDKIQTGVTTVTMNAKGSVEDGTVSKITIPDGSTVTGDTATFTVTQNGTYSFVVTTSAGKTTTKAVTVSNIKESGTDVTGIAAGTEISHTHIYANKYDSTNHWEECTICGAKRNITAHTLDAGYWTAGDSCSNQNNLVQKCSCGYSKISNNTRTHKNLENQTHTGGYIEVKKCIDCNSWLSQNRCYYMDSKGSKVLIDCTHPGTCASCGTVYTKENSIHYGYGKNSTGDINCQFCGTKIIKAVSYTPTLLGNKQLKLTVKQQIPSGYTYQYYGYYAEPTTLNKISSDASLNGDILTVNVIVEFKMDTYAYNVSQVNVSTRLKDKEGRYCTSEWAMNIFPEYNAPTVSVTQENANQINGWSTAKKIKIAGTEDYCKDVKITVTDNTTGTKILDGASTPVTNNNYSYEFTPNIEVGETARTYTVLVEDSFKNSKTTTFTLSKVDKYPPTLTSGTTYNSSWTRSKDVIFTATDNGVGGVQVSFNNNSNYAATTSSNGVYTSKNYHLVGDVYSNTTAIVYLKDAIGNETTQRITIGKIDNTSPTITGVSKATSGSKINITVTANDKNTTLNQNGSGIVGYAISKSKEEPEASAYQASNVLTVTETGTYYIYVKDAVGNISERYQYICQ